MHALALFLAVVSAAAVTALDEPHTILARGQSFELPARVDGDELWVPVAELERVSGFVRKEQGLCWRELCVPLPPDGSWLERRVGPEGGEATEWLRLTAFARALGQKWATDRERRVWSFSSVPAVQRAGLASGLAPDFALPDRAGRTVRLSDFRGKKVLLLAWASW